MMELSEPGNLEPKQTLALARLSLPPTRGHADRAEDERGTNNQADGKAAGEPAVRGTRAVKMPIHSLSIRDQRRHLVILHHLHYKCKYLDAYHECPPQLWAAPPPEVGRMRRQQQRKTAVCAATTGPAPAAVLSKLE